METVLIVVQIFALVLQVMVLGKLLNMLSAMQRHLVALAEFEKHLWFNQRRDDIFDPPHNHKGH